MSISKTATTAVVCASLLAGNLGLASTAAEARDGRRDRGAYAYGGGHQGYAARPRHYRPHAQPRAHYYDHAADQERRRDKKRQRIITGVAIGMGALILGSILANGGRHR